jgi:hypothetical protein
MRIGYELCHRRRFFPVKLDDASGQLDVSMRASSNASLPTFFLWVSWITSLDLASNHSNNAAFWSLIKKKLRWISSYYMLVPSCG